MTISGGTSRRLSGRPGGTASRRRPRFAVLYLAALLALLAGTAAWAVPPKYFELSDVRLDLSSGDIVAKLSIDVDNLTGLYEMLKDGASVELVVTARLERLRSLWSNVTLAEVELFSSLQHNPLTREFSLYMPGESTPVLDKNLERLLDSTWHKFSVDLGPLRILDGENGSDYRVTLSLALQHAKPPPWLARNFLFWSKTILDPEKVELPFSH